MMNGTTAGMVVTPTAFTTVVMVQDGPTGTLTDKHLDIGFIAALVCFAIGGVLLLIGFIKVLVWYVESRKHEKYSKWWLRQLEHRRHLEEYSIRTGDMASQLSTSAHSLTNHGFTHEEEETHNQHQHNLTQEDQAFSRLTHLQVGGSSSPSSSNPVAISTQSAQLAGIVRGSSLGGKLETVGMSNGLSRQDRNMNEIMDYL